MSLKDYLANLKLEPGDKLDYGIPGMKWGQRRSSAQLRAAAKARQAQQPAASGGAKGPTPHLQNHSKKSNIQDHVETSAARYNRLKAEAKAGRANQMTEQDLKFFNARTEALSKVAKMNEKKSGWLAETTKTVLQQSAQKQMQSITDAVANKYISGPIIENIGKAANKAKSDS